MIKFSIFNIEGKVWRFEGLVARLREGHVGSEVNYIQYPHNDCPFDGTFQLETTFERTGAGTHKIDHAKEQDLFYN